MNTVQTGATQGNYQMSSTYNIGGNYIFEHCCSCCEHYGICKFEDRYKKASEEIKELLHKRIGKEDFVQIDISCKHYKPISLGYYYDQTRPYNPGNPYEVTCKAEDIYNSVAKADERNRSIHADRYE